MSAAQSKKGSKGSDLPEVSADDAAPRPEVAPSAKLSEATAVAGADRIGKVEREVARLDSLFMMGALGVALAILMVVFSPMWAPQLVANDGASVRTSALAAAHLHVLAAMSQPFQHELVLVSKAIPAKDKELATLVGGLESIARTGAPTKSELAASFAGMADQMLVGKVMGKDEGWVNWTAAKVASAVRLETVVTTIGPDSSNGDFKLVHEVEKDLAVGDLKAAVERVSQLTGTPAEVTAGWLDKAKNRLALDETLEKIEKVVAERASQGARFSLN